MTTEPPPCPNCGKPVSSTALMALCPDCLLKAGLATATGGRATEGAAMCAPLSPEQLAPHFPQLKILECLGRGGMGVVYKALQKTLNRIVALKLLAPERVTDPRFAERFAREAQALAALNHPNIVTVHEFGCTDGIYFLVMEFVDGVNLRQAMKASRFTPEQALAVVPPVCEALQYAHEHGIVHRDIKPENLLLDKDGRVKIADFGIAKMLGDDSATGPEESQPAGTPQYMAPEQKHHLRTDHRADIYSLGVVLYEMLTGELPGAKLQPPSSRLHGLQIDVRLDEIVLRALEKTPELRFQTAAEMRTQANTIAATPPLESGSLSGGSLPELPAVEPPGRPPRFSRTAVAGCICLALLGLPVWLQALRRQGAPQPEGWLLFSSLLMALIYVLVSSTGAILGWISVLQISRSEGKLRGLKLAVFDGLVFPLLALDGVILRAWLTGIEWATDATGYLSHQREKDPNLVLHAALPAALLTAAVVDYIVIRRVWRAVNRPLDLSLPAVDEGARSRIGWKVTAAAGLLLTLASIWLTLWFGQGKAFTPPAATSSSAKAVAWERAFSQAFQTIASRNDWPESPEAVCKAFWEARRAKNYAEMAILWPGSASFDWPAICRSDDPANNYVLGKAGQDKEEVPYASEEYFKQHGDYNLTMLVASYKSPRGTRFYIRGGNGGPPPHPEVLSGPKATLPSGVTVELVGLSENPSLGKAWWTPDGASLAASPYSLLNASVTPGDGQIARELAVRLGNLPFDAVSATWKFIPSANSAGGGAPPSDTGVVNPALRAIAAVFPTNLDKCGVRFGLAAGPWTTLATTSREGGTSGSLEKYSYSFAPSFESAHGVSISVACDAAEEDTRIVAIDTNDRLITSGFSTVGGTSSLRQLTASFPGLHLADIKRVEIQSRAYQWAEFRNVSLYSGRKTEPSVRQPGAIEGHRSEKKEAVAPAHFGEVIQRILTDENNVIAFESGALTKLPDFTPKDQGYGGVEERIAAGAAWVEKNHWDALYQGTELVGCGMTVKPLAAEQWDTLAPEALPMVLGTIETNKHPTVRLSAKVENSPVYAFGTREGSTGILQIVQFFKDATEGKTIMRIRYKLLQNAGGLTRSSSDGTRENDSKPAFGPMVECSVPFGAPCEMQRLQFRSGRLFVDGHGPGTTKDQSERDWKIIEEAGGVDASALGGAAGFQFCGEGCLFTREPSLDWQKVTAQDVVARLRRATWITGVIELKPKDLPQTYLFKTARGEMGFMELLEIVETDFGYRGSAAKAHGVKLRYRLVQGVGEKGEPSAPTPSQATPAERVEAPVTEVWGKERQIMAHLLDPNAPAHPGKGDVSIPDRVPDDTFIDFDTGHLASAPKAVTDEINKSEDPRVLWDWARGEKLDAQAQLVFDRPGSVQLGCIDMVAIQVPNARWDEPNPTAVLSALSDWSPEELRHSSVTADVFPATFVFRTREGAQGLFQFPAYKVGDTSIKIRCKLMQPASGTATPKPDSAAESIGYGPVIERVIQGAERDSWAFNLASGKVIKSTPKLPLDFRVDGVNALRAAEVDIYQPIFANTPHSLKAIDMLIVPLGDEGWDAPPAKVAARLMEAHAPRGIIRSDEFVDACKAFAFWTREGAQGVLQIVAAHTFPATLRYKLLRSSPAPATGAALETDPQSEIIRLAGERLEHVREAHERKLASLSEVVEAEGEVALAEARGNPLKKAEARLVTATQILKLWEPPHAAHLISDDDFNRVQQRKLEAEVAVEHARTAPAAPVVPQVPRGANTASGGEAPVTVMMKGGEPVSGTIWLQGAIDSVEPGQSNVTQAARGHYGVRLPNGVEVKLLAVAVAPRLSNHWWQPDGTPLKEQPADRLQFDASLPADRAKPENEVALLLHQSWPASKASAERWPGDERPVVTTSFFPWVAGSAGGAFLWRNGAQLPDAAVLAEFKDLPETIAYRCGVSVGPWERVATLQGDKAQGSTLDATANFITGGNHGWTTTLAIRHNIDRENYHRRVVALLKDGTTQILGLSTPDTREAFITERVMNEMPPPNLDYVTVERRRCYWAEISDIVLHSPSDASAATAGTTTSASNSATFAIDLKVAQQQYEKTLKELLEAQKESASIETQADGSAEDRKKRAAAINARIQILRQRCAELRAQLQPAAK